MIVVHEGVEAMVGQLAYLQIILHFVEVIINFATYTEYL